MTQYTDGQREKIIKGFLDWCEKIQYTDPDEPVKVDIVGGLPIGIKRATQSVRFDIDLSKSKQNSTM